MDLTGLVSWNRLLVFVLDMSRIFALNKIVFVQWRLLVVTMCELFCRQPFENFKVQSVT